jgi:hypothetical protein
VFARLRDLVLRRPAPDAQALPEPRSAG